ncbi:hypothetical protein [Streptomyces xiamenensis]|uniref:hypothetical protein n=1 Tax=Streptomyces xiamenensis TaxID=408015 RepID=UPI0035D73B21
MALVDDIEFYGHLVESGEMSRAAAAAALAEASRGGLTLFGAGTAIDGWSSARKSHEDMDNAAFHNLAAIRNGRGPHPSSGRLE